MSSRKGVWLLLALASFGHGCGCESLAPLSDAGLVDAGAYFGGLDGADYEFRDSGPRPPEPCDVPSRRLRFPVGDASLGHTNQVWGFGSQVWAYLGGFGGHASPPASLHLFDLDSDRELDLDVMLGERESVVGVFQAPMGYELVMRNEDDATARVVHVGRNGRATGAPDEPLELSARPLVRLDDGRYVAAVPDGSSLRAPASLEFASPSGPALRIDLGFETGRGYLTALHATGTELVGIAYQDAAARAVRFEVDLETAAVRLMTLVEGVRVSELELTSSVDVVTAAIVHAPADEAVGSMTTTELFWWSSVDASLTRLVVRPPSDLSVRVLALGGEMPRQTLVLAQHATRAWVTAARIRGIEDVVGGSEPIGVFLGVPTAAAWQPSDGTVALALLMQHELEVVYLCEGAP